MFSSLLNRHTGIYKEIKLHDNIHSLKLHRIYGDAKTAEKNELFLAIRMVTCQERISLM
jgi:hypothetical protein